MNDCLEQPELEPCQASIQRLCMDVSHSLAMGGFPEIPNLPAQSDDDTLLHAIHS